MVEICVRIRGFALSLLQNQMTNRHLIALARMCKESLTLEQYTLPFAYSRALR